MAILDYDETYVFFERIRIESATTTKNDKDEKSNDEIIRAIDTYTYISLP